MDPDAVLRSFHARRAGASRFAFGGDGAAPGGSYRRLADAVRDDPVLDLGCGDGTLLELLAERGFDASGADMSPEELAAAERRLAGRARLHLADARALPVPDAAFATVVSHMAFMLMRPIEEIVAEVARALRPGGVFVAVVARHEEPKGTERLVFDKVFELLRRERVPPVHLLDDRTGEADGLASLFPAPTWTAFAAEDFDLVVRVSGERFADWLEAAFYSVDLISPAGRDELRAWIEAERPRLAPDGVATWTMAARQFVVRRS